MLWCSTLGSNDFVRCNFFYVFTSVESYLVKLEQSSSLNFVFGYLGINTSSLLSRNIPFVQEIFGPLPLKMGKDFNFLAFNQKERTCLRNQL